MKKKRDLDRFNSILELLQQFEERKIDLLVLTQKLNALTSCLETIGEDWYWAFKKHWAYLEAIYYSAATQGFLEGEYLDDDKIEIHNRIQQMRGEVNLQISKISLHRCPSCGYDISDSFLWDNPKVESDFCDCCGISFKRGPMPIEEARTYRNSWLQHPLLWRNPKAIPQEWNLEDQVSQIPLEYW